MALTLDELIQRKKDNYSAKVVRSNAIAFELESYREREDLSLEETKRVAQLKAERASVTSEIAEMTKELADLGREKADELEVERKQRQSFPTGVGGDGVERVWTGGAWVDAPTRSASWVNRETGERADVARDQSIRSHPAFQRSARPDADAHTLAQFGGIGQMLRAMSTTGGSAVVPSIWAGDLIDKAREQSAIFRAGATLIPMDAKTVKIGRLTGDPTASFRAEGSEITASDVTLDNVTLDAHTMSTLVIGSLEWFQDADNADQIVSDAIAKAMAEHLDLVGLYGGIGSGAGSIDLDAAEYPTGVLKELLDVASAPHVLGATAGTVATNGTQISSSAAWDQILDLIFAVKNSAETPNAIVWASRMEQKLAKLYDTTGQPLRQPEEVAALTKIATTKIPTYTKGTLTTATDVFAGDWSQLLVGQRLDITINVLTERYAEFGQIGVVAHWRGDFALARPTAFAAFKALQGA